MTISEMNILVTGGCGYKGTVLVPKLLAHGCKVRVLDTMWFGNFLAPHPNLSVVQGDVRDIDRISLDDNVPCPRARGGLGNPVVHTEGRDTRLKWMQQEVLK